MAGEPGPHFRTLFVVNPNARHGRTRATWPDTLARLESVWRERPDWCFTDGPGDATVRTRAALAAGYELVVAVGGDGTNNEVINGFFEPDTLDADGRPTPPRPVRAGAVFGWLTSGTGGDFQRTFGAGNDVEAAARRLAGRTSRAFDVGRVLYTATDGSRGVRYFANIASAGLGGEVDLQVNKSRKRLGHLSFAVATLRALVSFQPTWIRVKIDDQPATDLESLSLVVANGRYFGGGMMIAPDARVDDGVFDIVVLRGRRPLDIVSVSSRIRSGAHIGHPRVLSARGRRVEATLLDPSPAAAPVWLDVDGEVPGQLPATFELVPDAVRLKA